MPKKFLSFLILTSLFLITTLYLFLTTSVKAQTCTLDTLTPRADGLISTPQILPGSRFGVNVGNQAICAVDPSSSYVPFKIPTYADLKSTYYDQAKTSASVTKQAQISGDATQASFNFTSNTIAYVTGNLNLGGNPPAGQTGLIFVGGNLNINSNYTYGGAGSGTVFVVQGDVNIDQAVTTVNAVIISSGNVCTATQSGSCPVSVTNCGSTCQLTINGSIVTLDPTKPIKFRRSLGSSGGVNDDNTAGEKIQAQAKYLVIMRKMLASSIQKWTEITGNTGAFIPSPVPSLAPSPSPSPSVSPSPSPSSVPTCPTGAVGYWKLDEASGNLTDSSGNSNTGTPTGTTSVVGKTNNARSFNGSSDFIGTNNSSGFQIGTGTLSAWIKTSNAGSSYRGIVVKNGAYSMFLQDNVFMIYDWGTNSNRSSGMNLADNTWHHVAITFQSGVSSGTILYVDGVAKPATTMTVNSQADMLRIGSSQGTQYFVGAIDEVGVWNRVLSSGEIGSLFNGCTVATPPSPSPSPSPTFDYSLSNSGLIEVLPSGSSFNTITATKTAGTAQNVSYTVSGLPVGATPAFNPSGGCLPSPSSCDSTLTITTSNVVEGSYPITVTGSPLSKTTSFNLIVAPVHKKVFVTNSTFPPTWQTVSAANNLCQSAVAGIPDLASLTWKAWVSTGGYSPANQSDGDVWTQYTGSYRLVDGTTVVANNWTDLTDGTLVNAINKTEYGTTPSSPYVWTNTSNSGNNSGNSCDNWRGTFGYTSQAGDISVPGSAGGWTDWFTTGNCSNFQFRLYCFQQ